MPFLSCREIRMRTGKSSEATAVGMGAILLCRRMHVKPPFTLARLREGKKMTLRMTAVTAPESTTA